MWRRSHSSLCVQGDGQSCVQTPVLKKWRQQRKKTYCGPASLAIVLSSLLSENTDFDEDDILRLASANAGELAKYQNTISQGEVNLLQSIPVPPSEDKVARKGMSLPELEATALHLPGGLELKGLSDSLIHTHIHKGQTRWKRVHAVAEREDGNDGEKGKLAGPFRRGGGGVIRSVKELRQVVVETLALDGRIIANYHMTTLGQVQCHNSVKMQIKIS
jgi:hypothetical protein